MKLPDIINSVNEKINPTIYDYRFAKIEFTQDKHGFRLIPLLHNPTSGNDTTDIVLMEGFNLFSKTAIRYKKKEDKKTGNVTTVEYSIKELYIAYMENKALPFDVFTNNSIAESKYSESGFSKITKWNYEQWTFPRLRRAFNNYSKIEMPYIVFLENENGKKTSFEIDNAISAQQIYAAMELSEDTKIRVLPLFFRNGKINEWQLQSIARIICNQTFRNMANKISKKQEKAQEDFNIFLEQKENNEELENRKNVIDFSNVSNNSLLGILQREIKNLHTTQADTLDCISAVQTALVIAISENKDIAEAVRYAFLELNKHIMHQRSNINNKQKTVYLEDLQGDLVSVNSQIAKLVKGGEYSEMANSTEDNKAYADIVHNVALSLKPSQKRVFSLLAKGYPIKNIAEKEKKSERAVYDDIAAIQSIANSLYPIIDFKKIKETAILTVENSEKTKKFNFQKEYLTALENNLTPLQISIFELLAKGKGRVEIAEKEKITEDAARWQISKIKKMIESFIASEIAEKEKIAAEIAEKGIVKISPTMPQKSIFVTVPIGYQKAIVKAKQGRTRLDITTVSTDNKSYWQYTTITDKGNCFVNTPIASDVLTRKPIYRMYGTHRQLIIR